MLTFLKKLLFTNTSVRQTVVKNTIWLFSGEVLSRLIRGAIVIYSARVLGAAEYGVFSYVTAIAGFVTIFSDLGISAILTRESAKRPEALQEYFSTALGIKGFFILCNTAIVLWLVPLVTRIEGVGPLLPLVAVMLIFETIREFGIGVFRATERMEREAFLKVLTNVAISGLGFAMIWYSATAYTLTAAYTLGAGIGFLGTVIVLFPYFRQTLRYFRPQLVGTILRLAWPIGLLGVLGSIMINTDMIMLAWWQNATQVGYYAAGQKPIQLLYVVPALLASAFFPTFARLAVSSADSFRLVLERSITVTLAIAFPVITVSAVVGQQLLTYVYGIEYAPAVPTFMILLATIAVVFPSTILSNALFAYNRQKQFIIFVAVGALSNGLFNCLLIPRYGIEGAAVATIGSQLVANWFVWRAMYRTNPFGVAHRLGRILAASLIAALLSYGLLLLSLNVVVVVLCAALFYLGLLWLLREPVFAELKEVLAGRS